MKHSPYKAAEAASALVRGEPVAVGMEAAYAVELLDESGWNRLLSSPSRLLVMPGGATDVTAWNKDAILDAADPTRGTARPEAPSPLTTAHAALLALAKRAGLLPALLITKAEESAHLARFASEELVFPPPEVMETARAALPIAGAENANIVSFREAYSGAVHLALLIGAPGPAPLTRVHSSCVTGDLLGSLRCDCGGQLQQALAQMTQAGGGILLYLHQEGRDIGITNKLRAYRLQEMGYDTYAANRMLGFEEDERDFSIAAAMLKSLGVDTVRLLTNNPKKTEALAAHGITVRERLPLIIAGGAHNEAYLSAKSRAGHQF